MFHDSSSATRGEAGLPNTCPRCGSRFRCGMEAGAAVCWCAALPGLAAVDDPAAEASCYCPACLEALRAARREKATARGEPGA